MIYKDIIREKWEVRVSHHAFIRAMERGITPDMIEATIKGGKTREFGRRMVKFTKEYKMGKVVCVGEKKEADKIKILTIKWG
ncbi:MAG: hypothetical protein HY929_05015 [Euryarchaeota archaeon]|nr:hypothetical protein [Euryarchaeota archaeon]